MSDTVKVEVLRTLNNGEFQPGDEREMSRADAETLAATGAVVIKGAAKADAPLANKKEPAVANKSTKKAK